MKHGNLEGTLEQVFELGQDDGQTRLQQDGADLRLYDQNNADGPTLTELRAGAIGLDYAIITTEGGLVYDTSGNIVIKDVP